MLRLEYSSKNTTVLYQKPIFQNMLNELPPEIIVNISLRLDIRNKLSLMLTCKRLENVIYQRSFFDTIIIDGERDRTESIVTHFRNKESIGEHVKILQLNLRHLSDQLCSEIPLIFPNVEQFNDRSYQSLTSRAEGIFDNFTKWKDTIIVIKQAVSGDLSILHSLLEKDVFSCLTYLKVSSFEDTQDSLRFSSYIKNTPVLTHLEAAKCTLTINDIENFHHNTPRLTTFNIEDAAITVTKEETLPKGMIPASNVTQLSIYRLGIIDENCVFLEYIVRKYPNLISFTFRPEFKDTAALDLFYPNLYIDDDEESNPEFDEKLVQIASTMSAYVTSVPHILLNLPATLEDFTLDYFEMKNIMTIFTPKFSNIRKLKLFFRIFGLDKDGFKQTDHIDMLKNLTKLKNLSIVLDPSIHQCNHQGPLSTSVTTLDVSIKGTCSRDDMDIGWIFSMFPSVNELSVYSSARLIGYEGSRPRVCPNLTKLIIGPEAFHKNLLKFIHHCAPNLKELEWKVLGRWLFRSMFQTLEGPTKEKVSDHNFDLTGFSLDCFHLYIDLRNKWDEPLENVLINLQKKDGIKREFAIMDEYRFIILTSHPFAYTPPFPIDTNVTIKYDFTKKISINRKFSLDLEKSNIISSFL